MGRLAGFRYREVARKLRACGFTFDRPGPGSHEIWRNPETGRKVTLPHHSRDMAEGTLRAVLREAGVDVESFLSA
jgi:predicted RNA binding protein YcfA (HicA-like mRNA interferase family)